MYLSIQNIMSLIHDWCHPLKHMSVVSASFHRNMWSLYSSAWCLTGLGGMHCRHIERVSAKTTMALMQLCALFSVNFQTHLFQQQGRSTYCNRPLRCWLQQAEETSTKRLSCCAEAAHLTCVTMIREQHSWWLHRTIRRWASLELKRKSLYCRDWVRNIMLRNDAQWHAMFHDACADE